MTAALELSATPIRRDPRAFSTALLLASVFFMAIFPTLRWQEFSNTLEALNVATALEIRNTGHWLVPTLQGETRLAKPPVPAWITAAVMPADTLAGMASTDRDVRVRAGANLAVVVRSVALLCAAGTLLATFALGKLLFDDDVGLVALIVAGTNVLMLRFGRLATTDIQLALWVTISNGLFCLAAIRQRWWLGLIGGGTALAIAMMCKGPVCLLQTVVPLSAYWLVAPRRSRPPLLPLVIGAAVFLLFGLAWYVLILIRVPNALHIWKLELTGYPDIAPHKTPVLAYAILLPLLVPWLIFFVAAIVLAARRRDPHDRLLLLLIFVPIFIMSFFNDRYDRYLLPMLPACSIITARLLVTQARAMRWGRWDKLINSLHWLLVAGVALGLPLVGMSARWIKTADGKPWFLPATGWQSAAFSAVILIVAILLQQRTRTMLILATGVLMLGLQSLFMSGYVKSAQAHADFRPMAELIWSLAPNVQLFHTDLNSRRAPIDLSIYLDRTIPLVKSEQDLASVPGSVGLLIPQPKGAPDPSLGPEWTKVVNKPRDGEHWWLFIRNSATSQPSGTPIFAP